MTVDHQQDGTRGSAVWNRIATDSSQSTALVDYLERMAADSFIQQVARETMALLDLRPGERVLEVGCGAGVFLPNLAHAVGPGGHVTAIDHAPAMVATAQERVADAGLHGVVTVEHGDAYALPYPDHSFDAAHCERVLMHLDDPVAALREMRRVVSPGGRVVVAETHWLGTQIDHPDHEAIELVLHRHFTARIRQPRMGLTLNRRLAEAGFVERRLALCLTSAMTYDGIAHYGLDVKPTVERLVEEYLLSRERAAALMAHLDEASQDQSFFGYGGLVVALGRVPE